MPSQGQGESSRPNTVSFPTNRLESDNGLALQLELESINLLKRG